MRNVLRTQTFINTRTDIRLDLTINEHTRRDGSSLLTIEQPALASRDDADPDAVCLDEAAQIALYIHLNKKFGGQ
ncbi:hypothetical protein HOR55_gp31 [Ralstonia phage RS-PII-1]|uniref:Uncharacterized protein n=1 Tax=Ralstonia phage RS-PII-1 TaxID=1932892 RepID=A0A1L7DQC8_9CAUD|nr:hypothetical protein HOR55_gp31 [Ralstonia phage RS-PII-1]APU00318.1 hypothetical protein [Ralstonia phage RS-PII-1]